MMPIADHAVCTVQSAKIPTIIIEVRVYNTRIIELITAARSEACWLRNADKKAVLSGGDRVYQLSRGTCLSCFILRQHDTFIFSLNKRDISYELSVLLFFM